MTNRVLVLRPLGLGDFLTGVPAYRAIARAFPGHERVLAAPAALHDLLLLVPDTFHRAIHVRPLDKLPSTLEGVSVAIDLHGRGPASQRVLLALRPKRLIAFANSLVPESAEGARFIEGEHEVSRWCRMLAHAGIPADRDDLRLNAPCERAWFANTTIVHAGAASESRRWPMERWMHVVRHCESRGERVVLTGTRSERARAALIASGAGLHESRNLAGTTSLRQLAALVAGARRVLSGDTGIGHLASAYGTPSVLLFGPTSPLAWGPPQSNAHRVLWAGRSGDPRADTIDDGLLAISANEVIAEIERSDAIAHR